MKHNARFILKLHTYIITLIARALFLQLFLSCNEKNIFEIDKIICSNPYKKSATSYQIFRFTKRKCQVSKLCSSQFNLTLTNVVVGLIKYLNHNISDNLITAYTFIYCIENIPIEIKLPSRYVENAQRCRHRTQKFFQSFRR